MNQSVAMLGRQVLRTARSRPDPGGERSAVEAVARQPAFPGSSRLAQGGESDARWTLTAELSEPSRVVMPRGCKTRDVRDRDAPRGRFARTVRSYFEPKS